MPIQLEQQQFLIQNTESERFSFELIERFMREEDYTVFNVEEKILENFNHAYYQIVYIYSAPLLNDGHLETLFEKISAMQLQLRKTFLSFHSRILVIATNCEIRLDKTEAPKHVQLVSINNERELKEHALIKEFYPVLLNQPYQAPLPIITLNINKLSLEYAQKMNKVFNKKSFLVTGFLLAYFSLVLVLGQFFPYLYNDFIPLLRLNHHEFSIIGLLGNSFLYADPITTVVNILILIQFGLMMERIYGSLRYLFILLLSILLSNTLIFAFGSYVSISFGFSPIIYGLFGAFVYSFLVFRRLFAYTLRKMMSFFVLSFIFLILFFDIAFFVAILGAFIGGLMGSFIVGIPYARNSTRTYRLLTTVLMAVILFMGVLIGLK